MDYQQAFKILNLPIDSNREEIEKKYKKLSKVNHPDKGGRNEIMADISIAEDIALAYCNRSKLVPIELTKEINKGIIEYQTTFNELKNTEKQITKKYVSTYKIYKNFTGIFGVLSGGFAFINTIYSDGLLPFEISPIINRIFFIWALIMGFFYWFFSTMAETINNHIIEVLDEFDDKETYINVVNEIIPTEKRHGFTKSQLIEFIGLWLEYPNRDHIRPISIFYLFSHHWSIKKLAGKIGHKDFSQIIILKGLKNGVLEEKEIIDDQGYLSLNYILKLKPRAST